MRNFSIPDTKTSLSNSSNIGHKNQSTSASSPSFEEVPGQQLTGSFPPFEVLLSWLTYSYDKTGEWPLPPLERRAPVSNAYQKVIPDTTSIVEDNQACSETNKNRSLWVVRSEERVQDAKLSQNIQYFTGFDYVNSSYFAEATRLIEKYAEPFISEELLFGCKRVLSLIITWCNFPLFNGWSNRQGHWMVLGTAHCARELKMRIANFKNCVVQLELAGLIVTGRAGIDVLTRPAFEQLQYDCSIVEKDFGKEAATFWSRHSIQSKTTVYSLPEQLELDLTLPASNPFIVRKDLTTVFPKKQERLECSTETEALTGKTDVEAGKDFKALITQVSSQYGSFPGVLCHDKLIHDVDNNTVPISCCEKIDEGGLDSENTRRLKRSPLPVSNSLELAGRLTSEQKLKFEFLDNQAKFEGYCRKDGRATLDTQEAFRFALMEQLTFEQIELRYSQVSEMWSKGYCKRNPIGLLHWAISHNCDPRGYDNADDNPIAKQSEPLVFELDSVTTHSQLESITSSSKPRSSTTTSYIDDRLGKNNYRRSGEWNNRFSSARGAKKTNRSFPVATKLLEERRSSVKDLAVGDDLSETKVETVVIQPGSLPENLAELWHEIVDYDLAGRFRLEERQLANLSDSRLEPATNTEIPETQKQLRIVLRSIVEETQLELATRNTIGLAIRQKLGPGYKIVFTSPV